MKITFFNYPFKTYGKCVNCDGYYNLNEKELCEECNQKVGNWYYIHSEMPYELMNEI